MTMLLDKKIPNDTGFVIATVKSRVFDTPDFLQIRKAPTPDKAKPEGEATNPNDAKVADQPQAGPEMTSEVRLTFNLKTLQIDKMDDVIKDLTGQKVGIRLEHFFPTGSPTDRLLEDIRFQLELNRLGQFQLAH